MSKIGLQMEIFDAPNLSLERILQIAASLLAENKSETPRLDASVLLCHVLDKPRSYLLTWPEKTLTLEQTNHFQQVLKRRLEGEPIAYIIGVREFWSLPLEVSSATLIPRADTERLVELALEKTADQDGDILDLGTGTGAIALALASELPQRKVIGIDLMQEAQELATRNAQNLNIQNVKFLQGSWFEPFENTLFAGPKFSCIVSNPPYIDKHDPHLARGDVRFEPMSALVAADKGLADLRYISDKARNFLHDQGWILLEHGYKQGAAVREILNSFGYQHVVTSQDYAQNDRVTLGQWFKN